MILQLTFVLLVSGTIIFAASVADTGSEHPCFRKCIAGDNRVCNFNFTVEEYITMSIHCGNCPMNVEDCSNKYCIATNGKNRAITEVNSMIPGPGIHVCENDTIVVRVRNELATRSTTIHWHGMHQRYVGWMDGTPYLTQCPILPYDTFEYRFIADTVGTHIWHAHSGYQEADGLFGQLVVREPNSPNAHLYDFDLPEHTLIIWHFLPVKSRSWFNTRLGVVPEDAEHLTVTGYDFLINGKSSKVVFAKDGKNYTTPREVVTVEKGKRYRFRTIFQTTLYCPIQVSVEKHNITMIGTDNGEFEPVHVQSFMMNAGERYDFVLEANQEVGTYWIHVRGMGLYCNDTKNNNYVNQAVILKYKGSKLSEPASGPSYDDGIRRGKVLNPINRGHQDWSRNEAIKLTDLVSVKQKNFDYGGKPDEIIYMDFRDNAFMSLAVPGPYPQINNLTFEYPGTALLNHWVNSPENARNCSSTTKHYNCVGHFCTCPYVYKIKKNALVEFVLVDTNPTNEEDHPMHLHGNNFVVVAQERVGKNVSLDYVHQLNERGLITKNLKTSPFKDTVNVPTQGFVVLRYKADNPGYWFFHCHLTLHSELGMAVVVKVGEDDEIKKPPANFPTCGDWAPGKTGKFM